MRDLEKARSSRTKNWPPEEEFAWVEPANAAWTADRDGMAERSIRVAEEGLKGGSFQSMSAGLPELERLPSRLAALDQEVPSFLLSPALAYMSNSIERNGTGGAAFRTMYAEWLEVEAARLSKPGLAAGVSAAAVAARRAEGTWHALASDFMNASIAATSRKDREGLSRSLSACAGTASALLEAERGLVRALAAASLDQSRGSASHDGQTAG